VTVASTNRGLYADTSNTWRFYYNTNVFPLLARVVIPGATPT